MPTTPSSLRKGHVLLTDPEFDYVHRELLLSELPDGQPGVRITGSIRGLAIGSHGFHVHTNPLPTANSGFQCTAAGLHFNPRNAPHGAPSNAQTERHVGDLGNLRVQRPEEELIGLCVDVIDRLLSLGPEDTNYIGNRSIVVHKEPEPESEAEPEPKLDEEVDSKQKLAQETTIQDEYGKNEVAIEDV